ncbi:alcohol dehydrogenase catalytic domain-containing protein [Nocardia farcinica]|uniref:alcohol dehydrogenase catalytic domain-containing protein n=1 Tax=Nocardia farcinica TaxID=37329 RepID=UPI0024557E6A|nr:zinc-binding dehydrogenase [Nocardia farcinica]
MSPTFRAAVVRTPGGPDAIELIELPVSAPGPGEVRVAVAAATVNPVDLSTVGGLFHQLGLIHQPDHVGIGWDFAGTVAAAGAGVDLPVGTRVAGVLTGFDRDLGAYAEQLVVPAAAVAPVPDALDLPTAATVGINGLAASQLAELLGDGPGRLLITGAAGTVGAYLVPLARDRGWQVTGLARAEDEPFLRDLGAEFTTAPAPGFDAVADAAALGGPALALVRDGGTYLGVRPGMAPAAERDITVDVVETRPDTARLAELLDAAARGVLPTRVHAVVPLSEAAAAHRAVAKGGVRGKYVLAP